MPAKKKKVVPSGETAAEPTVLGDSEAGPVAADAEPVSHIEVSAVPNADEIDVVKPQECLYLRTYSKQDHGPAYRELAQEFASSTPGTELIDGSEIEALKVTYSEHSKALDMYVDKSEVLHRDRQADFKKAALRLKHEHNGTIYYRW